MEVTYSKENEFKKKKRIERKELKAKFTSCKEVEKIAEGNTGLIV